MAAGNLPDAGRWDRHDNCRRLAGVGQGLCGGHDGLLGWRTVEDMATVAVTTRQVWRDVRYLEIDGRNQARGAPGQDVTITVLR